MLVLVLAATLGGRPAMGNCSRALSVSPSLAASASLCPPRPLPPPPHHLHLHHHPHTRRDRSYAHPCTSLPIFSTSRPPNPHRRPKDLASCLLASWTWAVDPTHEKSLSGRRGSRHVLSRVEDTRGPSRRTTSENHHTPSTRLTRPPATLSPEQELLLRYPHPTTTTRDI
jgi:hypothetical protein